jgi:GNAT superfamily N-acetyltransferase
MTTHLHASDLADNQLALALPLVQITWPETNLAAWREFARGLRAEGGGLVALTEGDYICGVMAYRRQAGTEGPVLSVPLFTVADLANRRGVAKALVDAADELREKLGCETIQLEFHPGQSHLAARVGGSAQS